MLTGLGVCLAYLVATHPSMRGLLGLSGPAPLIWGIDRQYKQLFEKEIPGVNTQVVQSYGVGAKAGEKLGGLEHLSLEGNDEADALSVLKARG